MCRPNNVCAFERCPACRCPRIGAGGNSDEFPATWRPQLTMQCTMSAGALESYFIAEPDLPKDSNLQCSLYSRHFEQVHQLQRSRGLQMPAMARIHTDSASGDLQ